MFQESIISAKSVLIDQKTSDVGLVSLRNDGIITFEPLTGKTTHTLPAMKYELDVFIDWARDEKLGFLCDNRELKKFESDIRLYAQKKLPLFCRKFAIVINPGLFAFLSKLFIYLNRPEIPTKTFTNVDDAIKWLAKH